MINDLNSIKKYIPQREPMILVDSLLKQEDKTTISGFLVLKDHVLVNDGFLSEAGILENMAQTAALGKGYEYALKNELPPIGFIGAVKNLVISRLPKVNEKLETSVLIQHEILNATIAEVQVRIADEIIASCELKIFLNPEIN